jgi:hypothetical protein
MRHWSRGLAPLDMAPIRSSRESGAASVMN